jgi:dual specificity tyrosine-phosphorylation-regulated kinase 2/3/4
MMDCTTDSETVEMMSPIDALYLHGEHFTEFEREEVLDFKEVFYVGAGAKKINAARGGPRNHGFDDSTGRYRCRTNDHVAYRYKLTAPLGKGAFGDCFRAYDYKRQKWVALKIIRNEPRFHRQGKVEVNVLEMLRGHDRDDGYSLVHMVDHMLFRNHLVITFELLGNDLYSELRAGGFAGFAPSACREISGDILRCLELLERLQVVHADLKPENILLRPEPICNGAGPACAPDGAGEMVSRAKVIDFGSSCFAHTKIHTYIQSRYYRSPEVILGLGYGPAIDMWSLGCILFELDGGCPLFPAKNEQDLLVLQLELLGVPPDHVLARAKRAAEFFSGGRPLRSTDRKGRVHPAGSRSLADSCRNPDPNFHDFVARCLMWDPIDRMTPGEAMCHPWMFHGEGKMALSKAATMLGMADPLNDSGLSSGDEHEQEVPCTTKWHIDPSPLSQFC